MSGLIGRKIAMTSIYVEGRQVPCTIIKAAPCVVTQLREEDKDGYRAVQMAGEEAKPKHVSKALQGHFKKSGGLLKRKVMEFRNFREDLSVKVGQVLELGDVFELNEYIDVLSYSKGKGFQGVVKRHGFSGVGETTHGQHNRVRAPGSIGGCSYPARVFKGMRMAGRMGGKRVKALNLKVVKIVAEDNLLLLRGAVPGPRGCYVKLEK